jgi:hypothetical protein
MIFWPGVTPDENLLRNDGFRGTQNFIHKVILL